MAEASLQRVAEGRLQLSGMVDLHSGAALYRQAKKLAAGGAQELDCSGVADGSSSVCLSLLLSLQRDVQAAGGQLQIRGLPEKLRRIAGMYGVQEILPLTD